MLVPQFSERTASDVKRRIVKFLQDHYSDKKNWRQVCTGNAKGGAPIWLHVYDAPTVCSFADSGQFDDIVESVFLRVLKDMVNFGTVSFNWEDKGSDWARKPAFAEQRVDLNARLLPARPVFTSTDGGAR